MFGFIKKLLFSRQLKFEEGSIKLLEQDVSITPVILFVAMFKELKKSQPESYGKTIYDISVEVGKKYSEILKRKYGMNSQKIAEWDMNTLSMAGLGKGEFLKLDFKKKISIIRVQNSPISKLMAPSKTPVDFVIAGYIAGSAKMIFNSAKMECREIKCQAMGKNECIFEVFEVQQ